MSENDVSARIERAMLEVREEIATRADFVYEALIIIDEKIKALKVPR